MREKRTLAEEMEVVLREPSDPEENDRCGMCEEVTRAEPGLDLSSVCDLCAQDAALRFARALERLTGPRMRERVREALAEAGVFDAAARADEVAVLIRQAAEEEVHG